VCLTGCLTCRLTFRLTGHLGFGYAFSPGFGLAFGLAFGPAFGLAFCFGDVLTVGRSAIGLSLFCDVYSVCVCREVPLGCALGAGRERAV